MKKLRSEYRKIKDSNSKMGESRSDWKFFEYMDAILGCKPSTRPPVVLDTMYDVVLLDHMTGGDTNTECITGSGESLNSSCSEPSPSPSSHIELFLVKLILPNVLPNVCVLQLVTKKQ